MVSALARVEENKGVKGNVFAFRAPKRGKSAGLSDLEREQLVLEFRIKARKLGRSILRKWHSRMDLEEVDSIVDLSLCEAVKRFDPSKGATFMTFLFYHLKGNLIRAVASAANANLVPSADIGAELDSGMASAIDIAEALCSDEAPQPDDVVFQRQLLSLSLEACDRLDDLEKVVVQKLYLEGKQLLDIARTLGYSRCHISRVKKKAIETLQRELHPLVELVGEVEDKKGKSQDLAQRKKVHRRRPRAKKEAPMCYEYKSAVNG